MTIFELEIDLSLSKKSLNQPLIFFLCQLGSAGLFLFAALIMVSCSPSSEKAVPATTSGSALLTANASGEGGWESSGGGGIACFNNEEIAKKAQAEMNAEGFLSPDLRSQIQSAMTLDSWEYFQTSSPGILRLTSLSDFVKATAFKSELSLQKHDSEKVFKKVLNSLYRFLPLLAQRMEMVSKHIPLSSWKGSKRVSLVYDADPLRPLTKNCVRIQIANRLSRSQSYKLPDVEISYDEEIFNKYLSEFDKALLISHEYLYVLGREGHHKNSDLIRRFNAFIFSVQGFYPGELLVPFSNQVMMMREIADYPFGDYMRFFKQEHSGHLASRYQSMIELMDFLRKDMADCLTKENYKKLKTSKAQWSLHFKCQKRSIEENPSLLKKLTPQQAFVFLGRFFFDRVSNDFNSEHLMTWTENFQEKQSPEQEKQVHYYCRNIDKVSGSNFADLKDKAQQYCKKDLGISPEAPNQAPFRRDFSCFSKFHLLVWHNLTSQENKELSIALDMDEKTGAVYSPPFVGTRTLVHSKVLAVEKDLGFGNQKTFNHDTYQLGPSNDEDQKLLRGLVDREPHTFVSAEVLVNGKSQWVKNLEDFKKIFSAAQSKTKILKMKVLLECSVTNTNLPASDWHIQ